MQVNLGEELEDYVRSQVEQGSFTDVGEFIRYCVRERRNAELAAALPDLTARLTEGLRSRSLPADPANLAADIQRRHHGRSRKAA